MKTTTILVCLCRRCSAIAIECESEVVEIEPEGGVCEWCSSDEFKLFLMEEPK